MDILIVAGDDVHTAALEQARLVRVGKTKTASVLNAPLDADASKWIGDIWDDIETALECAYREGMNAAKPLIDKAVAKSQELVQFAFRGAEAVRATIAERLNTYLQALIDGALRLVRPSISVGGRALRLVKVTVEQQINLSGSLKASLTEACELVAEGELSFSAEYSADASE